MAEHFICKTCGHERGRYGCPTCMRNYFMYDKTNPKPVSEWQNSTAFLRAVPDEWEQLFS